MNFSEFDNAEDMMKKTGLPPEECLRLVNEEINDILGVGVHDKLRPRC